MAESQIYNALMRNDEDTMKNLLKTKTLCLYGDTILHRALEYRKKKEIIQFLLEQGADVNAKNKHGKTPLHGYYITPAITNSYYFPYNSEVTKLLIEHGVDINEKDKDGKTLLHVVCQQPSSFKMTELLLELGFDPNARTNNGNRPLHYTVKHTTGTPVQTASLLIDNGADINARNDKGLTPLFLACGYNKRTSEMVKLLLENNADVNVGDTSEETPLYEAMMVGNFESSKLLLENGAKIRFTGIKKMVFYTVSSEGEKRKIETNEVPGGFYSNKNQYKLLENLLLRHLIKMRNLHLVSDEFLGKCRFSKSLQTAEFRNFMKACRHEAKKLRETISPNRTVRFPDLLSKNLHEVAVLLNVDEINEKLKEINFDEEFPIYSNLFKPKIKKCMELAELICTGKNVLQLTLGKFRMPDIVLEKILSYFSKQNLKKIVETAHKA